MVRRRKVVKRNLCLGSCQEVVFEKAITIRAICEGNVQNLSIIHCLLHTTTKRLVIVLRFYNCNRVILGDAKQVIIFFPLFAGVLLSLDYDTAIREVFFHGNIIKGPTCFLKSRRNIAELYLFLGQLFLINIHKRTTSYKCLLLELNLQI